MFSQARSLLELANGDVEAALETQRSCLRFVGGFVNGIPVVGHAKGVVHYVFGDSDGGASAMNTAWHSTAVMGGGAGGFWSEVRQVLLSPASPLVRSWMEL